MRILGLVLLIVGVVLLTAGIIASQSIASSFSNIFTGGPTDRSVWLMIGGMVAIVAGGVIGWPRNRG